MYCLCVSILLNHIFMNTDGLGKPVNPNKALSSLKLAAQGGQ